MNVNKVFIVGRLTDNPEKRTTPSGQSVCTLRIATNRFWTKDGQRQEQTEYHSVVLWQRLADIAAQYLQKGNLAFIEGRLQTRSWDDPSGAKKYRTEIIAESLQMGPKGMGQSNEQSPIQPAEQKEQAPAQAETEIPVIDEDEEINVKDIPF
jgi:single-strand DNA-binding protein